MTGSAVRNLFAGAIFVVLGAYFALEALRYDVGTLFKMGPGYMPLALGIALAVLGIAIAVSGFVKARFSRAGAATVEVEEPAPDPVPWRAIVLVVATILFFGFCIRGLGFVPTVFMGALVTAQASRMTKPVGAVAIAAGITALSTLVFIVGLRITVPTFGPWLGL